MTTSINGTTGVNLVQSGVIVAASVAASTLTPDKNNPSYFYAALAADVLLNNTANYFDGPGLTLGTGTWLVLAKAAVTDPTGNSGFYSKLWDGTTVYDSAITTHPGINNFVTVNAAAIVVNPTGPVKISVRGVSSASGKILANQSGNSKDSSITAMRIG